MKKRILSLCMVLALCLSLLPATALAADGDTVYVGGVELTGSTSNPAYATTDDSGAVITGSASESDYNIKWDGSTLTLKEAYITQEVSTPNYSSPVEGAAIGMAAKSGNAALTLKLEGDNTIEDVPLGIHVYSPSSGTASLIIMGDGGLDARSTWRGISVQSNNSDAALTIQNAKVEATVTSIAGNGVLVQAGGSSNASLTVGGGSLTATGGSSSGRGIYFYGPSSSNIKLSVSNNAIVRADGGIASGVNEDEVVTTDGTGIVFNNGTGTVYGSVTLQDNLEIGESESLDIPSGASLTIPSGTTLTNEGTVTNSGTLTNNGTINNSGTLPGNIQGTAPPSITTTSPLTDGTVGTAYSATLAAMGNPTLWTWSASTGRTLPNGLTLNESTGTISGNPTTAGTYNFTVKATNSGGSDSEQLSITISPAATVSVTGVSLNIGTLNLTEGGTGTLTATVEPDNATNKTVLWSSDNPGVATVNNGVVTARSVGTANITVTTVDQNRTATCAVTVTARTYNISADTATMNFGSVSEGYAAAPAEQTVTITNRGNQTVTLNQPTAENYEIGTLTATTLAPSATATFTVQPKADLGVGTYNETITISGSDGARTSLTASFTVDAIPVTGVSLNTGTLNLTEGGTGTLTATVEPDNATNKNVTWNSDNTSVATVDASGKVTAVSAGTATITVTTSDSSFTDTCSVTVAHGSLTHTPEKAVTCTAEGYTGDKVCTVCGEIIEKGETVPMLAHSYKDGTCTVCGASDPDYNPAAPTKPTDPAGQKGSANKNSNNPQTGDDSSMMFWLLILAVSGCAVMRVCVYNKRKKY